MGLFKVIEDWVRVKSGGFEQEALKSFCLRLGCCYALFALKAKASKLRELTRNLLWPERSVRFGLNASLLDQPIVGLKILVLNDCLGFEIL